MKKLLCSTVVALYSLTAVFAASSVSASQPSTSYNVDYHLGQTFDVGCMGLSNASEAMALVKGACIWLKINLYSVEVKTSLIIEHRVPDLLIQASTRQSKSPIPMFSIYDDVNEPISKMLFSALSPHGSSTLSQGISGGSRGGVRKTARQGGNLSNNINFYDVQIIGNPFLPAYEVLMESIMEATEIGSFCASAVTPFQPYYNSLSDMEWRFGLYERLASMYDSVSGGVTGTRNINNTPEFDLTNPSTLTDDSMTGVHWGYIYPRMGLSQQQSQYRSAALTAFRAVDIATNDSALHTNSGQWPPNHSTTNKSFGVAAVNEDALEDHKFQMNYPQMQSKSGCYNFPDKSFDQSLVVTDITPSGGALLEQKNNYIWTLWRNYKCCKKKGQVFVGKVEF
jgi:integrating conjugative element protein (TIGR03756 family)